MKQNTRTAIITLEKMYYELNNDKFGGELPEVIITIQSSPRAYGHVTTSKIWNNNNDKYYELNIGAESLNRNIEEITATLLHEMVHIFHLINKIQDTSRSGTYHNKRFKAKAEEIGLIIQYDPKIGYSITSASEDLIKYVKEKKWKKIDLNRETVNPNKAGKKIRKPSSTRKYICPACGLSVRATKDVKIMCYDCKEIMEKAV